MKKFMYLSLSIFVILTIIIPRNGDASEVLRLTPDSMSLKQLQTRVFPTTDITQILSPSVAVFQDLGFIIEDTEPKLGLITASKKADATSAGQYATAILSFLLILWYPDVDTTQEIYASLVTGPYKGDPDKVSVRVTFSRKIWDSGGDISTMERIESAELYQNFFQMLSKSIFLEAEKI
jgi:hypothetical protein